MKVCQKNPINESLLEWKNPQIKRDVIAWVNKDKEAVDYLTARGMYVPQWATQYENMLDRKMIDATVYPLLSDVSKLISKNNSGYSPLDAIKDVMKIKEKAEEKKRFSDEHKKEAERGSQIIYDDSEWIVRKIKTYEASAYYGRGTRWCITGSKSWTDETRDGRYFWDMHMDWGSILYFAEAKNQKISYEVVDSESTDRSDVRKLTTNLKVAIEIRPSGIFDNNKKKYKKALFVFYDVVDHATYDPPKLPGFPDIYQIAVDAGDVLEIESVVKEKSDLPIIYKEDLTDAGISIDSCAFLDIDRASKLPQNILARGYNYLLDWAEFDKLGAAGYEDEARAEEETAFKTSFQKTYGTDKKSDEVDEDWAGNDDKVSGDVGYVTADGKVSPTYKNSLANDKQNYRTAIYTSGGLLTKLKNPKTGELFKQYDLVRFAGDTWYIIDDEVLYQEGIVHFPRAALGAARSLTARAAQASRDYARAQLRTTNIWRNMENRFEMNLANFGSRPDAPNTESTFVMAENLTEGYLNLDTPRFYDKKTNTILCVDIDNRTYKTIKGTPKRLETKYNAVDDSAITTIAYILKNAGYDRKKVEEFDEKLKESVDNMMVREVNEAYTDLDKSGSKEYKGETVYRITLFVELDGRPQMYVIGLGERDTERINYFNPVIRSARYTTEESFLFLSEEKAYEFLRAFRKESDQGDEFDLKSLRVTEYHPVHEITRIIPIDSPLGRAFVGEQKIIKKKYE